MTPRSCSDPTRARQVDSAIPGSRDYDTYTARLQDPSNGWQVLGFAAYGERRSIDRVTGQMALLR